MITLFGVNIKKIKIIPKDYKDQYRSSIEFLIELWTSKDSYQEVHIFVDINADKFLLPGNLEMGTLLIIHNCLHKHQNVYEVFATHENPLELFVIRPTVWNGGIYEDLIEGHDRRFEVDTDVSSQHAPKAYVSPERGDVISGNFQNIIL